MHEHRLDEEESEWMRDADEEEEEEEEQGNSKSPDYGDGGVEEEDNAEALGGGQGAQPHQPKQDYSVLSNKEIEQLQEDDIAKVSSILYIPKSDACCLLHHFNWNIGGISDEWFAEEDKVREKVGLLTKPLVQFNARVKVTCSICFDEYLYGSEEESVLSAACGHPFCRDCWTSYISASINEGARCLALTCPEPKCIAAVSPDLISRLTSEEDNKRYKNLFLRSYVEANKEIKWCPGPDCQHAVKFIDVGTEKYDVSCICSYSFCWKCSEEVHRPVDCEMVNKWIMKNKDESQNAQWILVNTKPCPKCKKPIEKNQGCNHMTCRPPCGYHFCWYCLEDIRNHSCHGYRSGSGEKKNQSEDEKERKRAKRYLQRYLHYYERWATNLSSKRKAIEDLHKVETVHSKKLVDTQQIQSEGELQFVVDAWKQIIQCRQLLQWTFAYGYFMPEEEKAKVNLFEDLQGQAETSLERLHKCAETELLEFLKADGPKESFITFRMKLLDWTRIAASHFDKLLTAMENGLPEVVHK